MMLGSCNSIGDMPCSANIVMPAPWYLAIVDSAQNDCLNPKSPSYLGVEYIKKIEVLSPNENKELVSFGGYLRAELETNPHYTPDFLERIIGPVVPPGYAFPAYYYSIPITTTNGGCIEDGQYYGYTHVRYPDGSEDVIRIKNKHLEDEKGMVLDKIWVNDELALDYKTGIMEDRYYNPKYFPRMVSIFDDDGVQHGWMPEVPFVIIITK